MNTANMVATMGGVVLLGIAGRKTLMLINQIGCIVCLSVMWFATMKGNSNLELIMVILFVCTFEFGMGAAGTKMVQTSFAILLML